MSAKHKGERPSEHEAIEATAAAWLAERDDGWAAGREAEFARWCAADRRHEAAVARLDAAWSALQELRDFRPAAARHPDRDLLATPRQRPTRAWPALVAAAAAVAVMLGVLSWRAGHVGSPSAAQHYATTVDGYERVTLADASVLELNANSKVSVEFASGERRVRLLRGEAHFTVARDAARPFIVEAGGVAVRAVGTAFNVRLGARDVEVLVTEGKVQVEGPAPAPRTQAAAALLTANHRAVVNRSADAKAQPRVEAASPEVVREALAWQGPRLVFSGTPLREVLAQFNRRNQVQLELADAELGGLPIAGSFRAENVDAFVRLITAEGDIAVVRSDGRSIVLGRAH